MSALNLCRIVSHFTISASRCEVVLTVSSPSQPAFLSCLVYGVGFPHAKVDLLVGCNVNTFSLCFVIHPVPIVFLYEYSPDATPIKDAHQFKYYIKQLPYS